MRCSSPYSDNTLHDSLLSALMIFVMFIYKLCTLNLPLLEMMDSYSVRDTILQIIAMVVISVIVSYIILSNVMLTFRNGVYNHLNKMYMALAMGFAMGAIEIIIMLLLGHDQLWLIILLIIFIIITVAIIVVIRRQASVTEKEFMRSMIEHHDMAIFMAVEILKKTSDPRLVKLANSIISDQQREINDMKEWLKE